MWTCRSPITRQLSRRLQKLGEIQFHKSATHRPMHLLIDSTGLRIHVGHLRKPPRHRAWRKLHLAVDAESGQIVSSDLTSYRVRYSTRVPTLLEQTDRRLASLCADGAYDRESVYETAQRKGILQSAPSTAMEERNRNVRSIREFGRREWPKRSGYSRRSMVENAIYRYKTILGGDMRSRGLGRQRIDVKIGCKILNRMALFGMPETYKVE